MEQTFSGSQTLRAQLPELAGGERPIFDVKDLGWQRALDSLISLYYFFAGYPGETERFSDDGVVTYLNWEKQIKEGSFNLQTQIKASQLDQLARYKNYHSISGAMVELFRVFLQEIE